MINYAKAYYVYFHNKTCFVCIRMKVSVALLQLLCCLLLTDGQTEVHDFVANGKKQPAQHLD